MNDKQKLVLFWKIIDDLNKVLIKLGKHAVKINKIEFFKFRKKKKV